jgi:hypothetical protein
MHSEVHREQFSTQYNVITEISRIELGTEVKAEELTIPAAFWAGFETWTLQGATPKTPDELLPTHDLGKGAYVIDLPPSDSRALLVASGFPVVSKRAIAASWRRALQPPRAAGRPSATSR